MTAIFVAAQGYAFADGNTGHACVFTAGAPAVGALDVICANSDTLVSTPSGFTLIPNSLVANQGSYMFYRFAVGGETNTVTVTTSGNFNATVAWGRWSNALSLDVAASAITNGEASNTTPAINTGALAAVDELSIAFAALHSTGTGSINPIWSAGYTGCVDVGQSTGPSGTHAFLAYKLTAGTAAETPNVTWTEGANDRYMLVATFLTSGAVTVTMNRADETDSARPLAISETLNLGQAGESDTARALGSSETVLMGQAEEVDTARPMGISGGPTGGCFTFDSLSLDWDFVDFSFCPDGECPPC